MTRYVPYSERLYARVSLHKSVISGRDFVF